MSALDEKVVFVNLFHSDTKCQIGHVEHMLHKGQDWVVFQVAGAKDGFALPAREAVELGVALISIAQGLNWRGFPRIGCNPERGELQRLVRALESSDVEAKAKALADARATLDELEAEGREDEEGP